MKCQRCPKPATSQITDVLPDDGFVEAHLCEECARKYLAEPVAGDKVVEEPTAEYAGLADSGEKSCEICGLKFVEFRNTGRLGCPHDYDCFREELLPLLESIHGESRHAGKRPERRPDAGANPLELATLRKKLQQAVHDEDYEAAADLRDRIKALEDR